MGESDVGKIRSQLAGQLEGHARRSADKSNLGKAQSEGAKCLTKTGRKSHAAGDPHRPFALDANGRATTRRVPLACQIAANRARPGGRLV
jgi:hypothetical protein